MASLFKLLSSRSRPTEPVFRRRLRQHFSSEPNRLPTLTESFPTYDHASLHVAFEAELSGDDCEAEAFGFINLNAHATVTLSMLAAPTDKALFGVGTLSEGPVEYTNVTLDDDQVLSCIRSGLFLVRRDGEPLAILISGPSREIHFNARISVQVMARNRQAGEAFLSDLRTAMRKRNVYRGQVLSLAESRIGELEVKFHRLSSVRRDDIILPEGLLQKIERQTVRFSELSEKMLAAGRHLKRGILLYGPPGAGKTMTAMYVARAIQGRTVLLLTGRGQGLIERSCAWARMLQPSIVILEDVDLVAEERTSRGCAGPLLFELLNQMDGLADDADILFLLTTNRPEILEPALAARPGRVDQAIEIPLPDAQCRGRLFELYGKQLKIGSIDWEKFIHRTDGASGAFIREMMRKAALFAADGGSEIVENRHLDEAIHELAVEGGLLNRRLLGFASAGEAAE